MTFTQPEQRVRTGARRVRVARAVPMKAAAIIAALGIALIVTMGATPASAQTTVIRECGDHYVVTRYNSDGSVKGVHNKQLSAQGTIYTGGRTWLLVEGTEGNPDRFVSDGGVLQVGPCDTTRGSVRQVQTSTTLVSNTGQATGTELAVSADTAQPFATGSNAGGYRLTGVKLSLRLVSGTAPSFSVSIHEDSSGLPGSRLGAALTMTGSLPSTMSPVQFTASGNGRDLGAGKTYWVVLDVQAAASNFSVGSTNSYAEDSGAAAGWSIGNERRFRGASTTPWPAGSKVTTSVHPIAIEGYAKTGAALVSAEVNGTSLVLTFGNDLDTTSRPAARQFGIRFGGSGGALQRATAISISGRQVTLTVPEVRAGQVVTVSYTKPTSNPLKGSNGVEVAAFSGQGVTVKTGPAYGRLPASGKVRDAVYVTYTNANGEEETVEARAYSADRETLWDYFESQCRRLRSVSDPYRDYSLRDADGHLIQARNGWKYVYTQNAAGDVTGTRAMTISECASNAFYQRQAFCNNYTTGQLAPTNEDNVCPADRSW